MKFIEILILVAAIIIVVATLTFSIYKRVKARKAGKIYRGCTNSCSSCPYSSGCQTTFPKENKEDTNKNSESSLR